MTEWMDIGQLSQYLRVKKKTLYSMVRNGKIPSYRVSRMLRFKREEVDSWMEANRNTSACTRIEKKKIPVGDEERAQAVKAIVKEAVASVRERNRKKRPDKGVGKEDTHGNL